MKKHRIALCAFFILTKWSISQLLPTGIIYHIPAFVKYSNVPCVYTHPFSFASSTTSTRAFTYSSTAPADNLEISYHASVPEDLPFNAWDLTVILGNLIDNAVEAAAECPKGGRKINLSLESLHNCLTIEISNTFTGERFPHKDGYLTTKEAAGDHGFGLENIRRTVEKNDGTFSCGQKDGLFCARVIIPL